MEDIIDDILDDREEQEAVALVCLAAGEAVQLICAETGRHWRGRAPWSKPNVQRGESAWFRQYLCPTSTYSAEHFRRTFRVPLLLYRLLEQKLPGVEPLLLQKENCAGRAGHPLHTKILSSLRRLGTGCSLHDLDDHSRMSAESQRYYFMLFLKAVHGRFGGKMLNREPTASELQAVHERYAARGFPGCVGALDCMKLVWKNCPRAMKGQYHNPKDSKLAVISCEAVADSDLYCWNWFAGRPGTNNDVTVADYSPLFVDILAGRRRMTLPGGYQLCGATQHRLVYYLTDGIYPRWAIFVRSDHAPTNDKERHAAGLHASVRKDVERMFGCLQGRFHTLRRERHEWDEEAVVLISQVCVILHNMIVSMRLSGELDEEDGETTEGAVDEFFVPAVVGGDASVHSAMPDGRGLAGLLSRVDAVKSEESHGSLRSALLEHQWSLRGNM